MSTRKQINMGRKKAFTLIELLVVVSIIALLLSILVPALSKVKEQARFTICKTNLKQYGLAGALYFADFDDGMPNSYHWLFNYPSQKSCDWHNESLDIYLNPDSAGDFWPYLALKDIHFCPSLRVLAKTEGADHPGHKPEILISPQYSYSMNGYLGVGSYTKAKKLSQVRSPNNTFFFAEENLWTITGWSDSALNNHSLTARRYPYTDTLAAKACCFATFHNRKGKGEEFKNSGNSNAVFLDGAVHVVNYKETFKRAWPK